MGSGRRLGSTDPTNVPSYVKDMNINATMMQPSSATVDVRSNPVTCAVISDCISVLEFSDRIRYSTVERAKLMVTGALSVTHAVIVAYVFECVIVSLQSDIDTSWI